MVIKRGNEARTCGMVVTPIDLWKRGAVYGGDPPLPGVSLVVLPSEGLDANPLAIVNMTKLEAQELRAQLDRAIAETSKETA